VTAADSTNGLKFWVSVAPRTAGGSTVTVFGDLDASTSERVREALTAALEDGDIELDLRGCSFVDSSGIAVLVWAAWRLREREHRLVILGARPRVRGILELAGIAGHAAVVVD
jgi:anti-sigma B factor antagonist